MTDGPPPGKAGGQDATSSAFAKPEEVVRDRNGDVLIKQTLLKADHFPGCQNKKLTPLLDGAPNFRQIEGLPVYGVAIPTTRGLRNVLNAVGATHGRRRVLWHNMREEPVIYINGKPYVVREAGQPFANLEYTGIDRSRVEDMEMRLKQDILTEARQFDNHILVAEEDDDMQVIDVWEPVTESDVQTPLEVYAELIADGYQIDYMRVPVTDEKAPKDSDFELLIRRLWAVPPDAALIFNCQMGRGRTTTGMIIASLLVLRRAGAFGALGDRSATPPPPADGRPPTPPAALPDVPTWFRAARGVHGGSPPPPMPAGRNKLAGGMYGVIRSLLRVLERGSQGKAILDVVINAASAMQNLREAIATYRSRLLGERSEKKRATLMGVCLEYLERYYMLLAFTSYLTWHKFDPAAPGHVSFEVWMGSRPELRSILQRMLRRNPMAALELHIPAATLPMNGGPGRPQDAEGDLLRQAEDRAATIIEERSGAVLGPDTILKEDYFPGMKSPKLPQALPGASNFRAMVGFDIYGVAMSTVSGIRRVLQCVTAVRPGADRQPRELLWINMREEPVIYINGVPFVLRECARPMKNMQEYSGIDASRLEAMEQRLKADVLAEAARYGGRILVARESLTAAGRSGAGSSDGGALVSSGGGGTSGGGSGYRGSHGQLVDQFEAIPSPDVVQTPAEVYAALRQEGFVVKYVRVPVTDGRAPSPEDMDVIMEQVRSVGFQQPVVFNCQLGAGRTSTGMVVAGLLQLHTDAAAARQLLTTSSSSFELDLGRLHEETQGNSPRSEDDERDALPFMGPNVWELSPEEIEEQRALAEGGYVGVRRVVRLLENGDVVKRAVDAAIDANGQMLNLRMSILKYRQPRVSFKGLRSEVHQRHDAFTRGSAYLERYCMLIAFAAYLDRLGVHSKTSFSSWLGGRPDLQQALQSIHHNPAAALTAVPVTAAPIVYAPAWGSPGGRDVTPDEQAQVLNARRGKTLTRRIILKSYITQCAGVGQPPNGSGTPGGVAAAAVGAPSPDVRRARGLPIHTVGNVSVPALRGLLTSLGAGPDGKSHVVLTDVREELVVYVNGVPYIRRELEMPAAALHHAGIHAKQLLALETLLKEDVRAEAIKWGGRVLLHHELPQNPNRRVASFSTLGAAAAAAPMGVPLLYSSFLSPPNAPTPLQQLRDRYSRDSPRPLLPVALAPTDSDAAAAAKGAANGAGAAAEGAAVGAANGNGVAAAGVPPAAATPAAKPHKAGADTEEENIAAPVDERPGACVAPFWEPLDVSAWAPAAGVFGFAAGAVAAAAAADGRAAADSGDLDPRRRLATCLDIADLLAHEGFHISYRRVPLSRERTPEAGDLAALHQALLSAPGAATGRDVVHLVLARTATGSSARFAASALCCHALVAERLAVDSGADAATSPPGRGGGTAADRPKRMRRTYSDLGEYRGIMNVSRLLPRGMEVKEVVDTAIDRCERIGNLRADIQRCKSISEAAPSDDPATAAWMARQLGLHYLKRYFLLIAFTSYLWQRGGGGGGGGGGRAAAAPAPAGPSSGSGAASDSKATAAAPAGTSNFVAWVSARKELGHLLHHLTLET